jgi:hypothetical protein
MLHLRTQQELTVLSGQVSFHGVPHDPEDDHEGFILVKGP